ncbi:MAG: orotate phosphoribosyltransferase [Candidatus Altiarchaeota archaeon]
MSDNLKIAKLLVDNDIVQFNVKEPFRYTSGILSPIYTNCRAIMSLVAVRTKVIEGLTSIVKKQYTGYDGFSGTASAGIPWAAFLSDKMGKSMIYVREKPKDHGMKKQIEGRFNKGGTFIIAEDHITTGGSIIAEANILRDAGLSVNDCIAIFTYDLPEAKEKLADASITATTLTNINDAITVSLNEGKLSEADSKTIIEWLNDPRSWSEKAEKR